MYDVKFKKILIANRGEIACRIMRTAQRLNIHCIAIYSAIDAKALHVQMADEAYCVGAAPSTASYLNIAAILAVAKQTQAEAIHPGYGFLAENAEFAQQCQQAGIVFIGPSAHAIRALGGKNTAKQLATQANIPMTPGYHGNQQDLVTLQSEAEKIGYPILLKAVAGGGGRGMRLVQHAKDFTEAYKAAKREALASFANDEILLEKYFTDVRHIEVQIFGDTHGNYVHLFERDCSLQRRYQKIVEEAPAACLSPALRQQLGTAAITLARTANYTGAGTVEFLLDKNNHFYFMEMNTRLQVEHPITEMVTGQDLVEWQLRVASGATLPLKQEQIKLNGHAIEVRICAENPQQDFQPATGLIKQLQAPNPSQHVRIDTGFRQGDTISPYYDSLLAKLIVWGTDRQRALQCLIDTLADCQIIGIKTNLNYLTALISHPAFIQNQFNTQFIAEHQVTLNVAPSITTDILAMAALCLLQKNQAEQQQLINNDTDLHSPWHDISGWHNNLVSVIDFYFLLDKIAKKVSIYFDDKNYTIEVDDYSGHAALETTTSSTLELRLNKHTYSVHFYSDGEQLHLLIDGKRYQLTTLGKEACEAHNVLHETNPHLTAPMPGKLIAVLVEAGSKVKKGDPLAIIEAMKMEHTIHAPADGHIRTWHYQVGDLVNEGVQLLEFEMI